MKISKADLGWMAAVIDMKGHVIRKQNKTRKTPQLVLTVDTKDRRIAVRLSRLTGTQPDMKTMAPVDKFLRRGCAEHCPEPHVHVLDDQYPATPPTTTRWTLTGVAMAVVLANLEPYMSTYDEYSGYVDTIMAFAVTEGQGVGQVRASATRLKKLGWTIPPKIAGKLGIAA